MQETGEREGEDTAEMIFESFFVKNKEKIPEIATHQALFNRLFLKYFFLGSDLPQKEYIEEITNKMLAELGKPEGLEKLRLLDHYLDFYPLPMPEAALFDLLSLSIEELKQRYLSNVPVMIDEILAEKKQVIDVSTLERNLKEVAAKYKEMQGILIKTEPKIEALRDNIERKFPKKNRSSVRKVREAEDLLSEEERLRAELRLFEQNQAELKQAVRTMRCRVVDQNKLISAKNRALKIYNLNLNEIRYVLKKLIPQRDFNYVDGLPIETTKLFSVGIGVIEENKDKLGKILDYFKRKEDWEFIFGDLNDSGLPKITALHELITFLEDKTEEKFPDLLKLSVAELNILKMHCDLESKTNQKKVKFLEYFLKLRKELFDFYPEAEDRQTIMKSITTEMSGNEALPRLAPLTDLIAYINEERIQLTPQEKRKLLFFKKSTLEASIDVSENYIRALLSSMVEPSLSEPESRPAVTLDKKTTELLTELESSIGWDQKKDPLKKLLGDMTALKLPTENFVDSLFEMEEADLKYLQMVLQSFNNHKGQINVGYFKELKKVVCDLDSKDKEAPYATRHSKALGECLSKREVVEVDPSVLAFTKFFSRASGTLGAVFIIVACAAAPPVGTIVALSLLAVMSFTISFFLWRKSKQKPSVEFTRNDPIFKKTAIEIERVNQTIKDISLKSTSVKNMVAQYPSSFSEPFKGRALQDCVESIQKAGMAYVFDGATFEDLIAKIPGHILAKVTPIIQQLSDLEALGMNIPGAPAKDPSVLYYVFTHAADFVKDGKLKAIAAVLKTMKEKGMTLQGHQTYLLGLKKESLDKLNHILTNFTNNTLDSKNLGCMLDYLKKNLEGSVVENASPMVTDNFEELGSLLSAMKGKNIDYSPFLKDVFNLNKDQMKVLRQFLKDTSFSVNNNDFNTILTKLKTCACQNCDKILTALTVKDSTPEKPNQLTHNNFRALLEYADYLSTDSEFEAVRKITEVLVKNASPLENGIFRHILRNAEKLATKREEIVALFTALGDVCKQENLTTAVIDVDPDYYCVIQKIFSGVQEAHKKQIADEVANEADEHLDSGWVSRPKQTVDYTLGAAHRVGVQSTDTIGPGDGFTLHRRPN